MNNISKTCTRCKQNKPLNNFGRKKISKDGLNWWCKKCNVEYNTQYRKSTNGYIKLREYRLSEPAKIKARIADKKYKSSAKGREWIKLSRDRYKEKITARRLVYGALKNNSLEKMPCEICGEIKNVEAHHDDYSKPLEIRWLCTKHHRALHIRNEKNTNSINFHF